MNTTSRAPFLQIEGVDLWRASLDEPQGEELTYLRSLLSADEARRAERFHFARDRRRFIVGRGLLRTILGDCTGCAPRELAFRQGANGKPELADDLVASPWRFNLAHSSDLAVYAVAQGTEVGVDVERWREMPDWATIGERLFPTEDFARLATVSPAMRGPEFFRTWTRTEARLKAFGDGFGEPLPRSRQAAVCLHSFTPAPGVSGALAILFPNPQP
jgi:4'-phosphopantetheinyl transferase